jgi:hypothetical protein
VAEKRILSSLSVKPGKVLPSATAEMVKKCYVSDKISKIMQGQKMSFCYLRRQEGSSSEMTDSV